MLSEEKIINDAMDVADEFCDRHPEANRAFVQRIVEQEAFRYSMCESLQRYNLRTYLYVAIHTTLYKRRRYERATSAAESAVEAVSAKPKRTAKKAAKCELYKKEICERLKNGESVKEVAEWLDMSVSGLRANITRWRQNGENITCREDCERHKEEICTAVRNGENVKDIAARLNIGASTIHKYLTKWRAAGEEIKAPCKTIERLEECEIHKQEICDGVRNGENIKDIAARLNIGASTIHKYLSKWRAAGEEIKAPRKTIEGLHKNIGGHRDGSKSARCEALKPQICEDLKNGMTQRQIAEKYGINAGTLSLHVSLWREDGSVAPRKYNLNFDSVTKKRMCADYERGMTQRDIAAKYGVNEGTLSLKMNEWRKEGLISSNNNHKPSKPRERKSEEPPKEETMSISDIIKLVEGL